VPRGVAARHSPPQSSGLSPTFLIPCLMPGFMLDTEVTNNTKHFERVTGLTTANWI